MDYGKWKERVYPFIIRLMIRIVKDETKRNNEMVVTYLTVILYIMTDIKKYENQNVRLNTKTLNRYNHYIYIT